MNMYFVAFSYFLVAAVIVYYIRIKSQERMKLIEKGIEPNYEDRKKYMRQVSLRNGLFLLFAGLGFFLGHIIQSNTQIEATIAYFASIFLLCGLALIIYFYLVKKLYP